MVSTIMTMGQHKRERFAISIGGWLSGSASSCASWPALAWSLAFAISGWRRSRE